MEGAAGVAEGGDSMSYETMRKATALPGRRNIYYKERFEDESDDAWKARQLWANDLAAAQAEREALRERANALLHQIDIGDYVDSEGHALKNNIAVLTLMKALTNA